MNNLRRAGAGLVFLAFLANGCATRGYHKASETRQSIKDTQHLVAVTQQQIATVLSALDGFQGAQVADLRTVYRRYTAAVDELDDQQVLIARRNRLIQSRAEAYFDVWDRDLDAYHDAAVRERSFQRRRETMASVDRIQGHFAAVDGALSPLVQQMHDLERFLGDDLTQNGVTAGTDFMNRIRTDATGLQAQLQSLAGELDRLHRELSPIREATEMLPAGS